MSSNYADLKLFEKIRQGGTVRVCAFGSSNTQRFDVGMHWFDYLDLGFKNTFGGGSGQFINSGISGNTSAQMLERFDRDVARFQPDLTIVTCGGNDSNPARSISEKEFMENLKTLHARLTALGSEVIFQTYYACDLENLDPGYAAAIPRYMQIIRDAAAETGSRVQDNYARWERLRLFSPENYRLLMMNAMHVNAYGNMVIGLDWVRDCGLTLQENQRDYCRCGLLSQCALDLLERNA